MTDADIYGEDTGHPLNIQRFVVYGAGENGESARLATGATFPDGFTAARLRHVPEPYTTESRDRVVKLVRDAYLHDEADPITDVWVEEVDP